MLIMYYLQKYTMELQETHSKIMKIENTRNWVNKNVRRTVKLADLLKKKSFFLFGARGIGKSYLIHQELLSPRSETVVLIDLLNSWVFTRLSVSSSQSGGHRQRQFGQPKDCAGKSVGGYRRDTKDSLCY